MLSAEGVGKNIEKAIEDALIQLKAKREDVDIKILEEGGFFKKAKVLITISDDSKEKYAKKAIKETENIEKIDVKAMFADLKKEVKNDEKTIVSLSQDKKIEEKEIKEKKKEETKNKKNDAEVEEEKSFKESKVKEVNVEKRNKKDKINAKEFIKGFLKEVDIQGDIFVEESDKFITIKIEGGNSGDLIGHRGECLNAIQYISSIIEGNSSENRRRVILDIENYRSRREDSLKGLANRIAKKVIKTNKSIKLEPMNANERRIIHSALHKNDLVETISKGTEPNRFLIVLPKKEDYVAEEKETTTEEKED